MSKETNDWMDRLVENYKVPQEENSGKDKATKKLLNETQLKRILDKG